MSTEQPSRLSSALCTVTILNRVVTMRAFSVPMGEMKWALNLLRADTCLVTSFDELSRGTHISLENVLRADRHIITV